jgi:hypothetical protein
MGIGNSGHGVDLKELVRSNMGNMFNWSPVSEARFSIVEPLVGNSLENMVVNVSNSLCNFSSGNSSSKLNHLCTNFLVKSNSGLIIQELVVQIVSASDDFNIVEVMSIDGRHVNTTVVHLSSEDFVSKEVVSEDTSIRVSVVMAVSSGDIYEVTKQSVHRVVLLVDIIQMLSILINSVGSEHVLKHEERVVVFISNTWSIIEDSDVGVVHLIISDHQKSWNINWLLGVLSWDVSSLWKSVEVLFNSIYNFLMGYITSGYYSDVISIVVGSMEVSQVIKSNELSQISISLDWLSKHMFFVRVEVSVFNSSFFMSVVIVFVFSRYFLFHHLKFSRVQ